jgi:hypothetical protein
LVDAASEQARAAFTYGEIIGDGELRAWARGMQACVPQWSGRPVEMMNLVLSGQAYVSAGSTALVRLHGLAAVAAAMLGDRDGVGSAITAMTEGRAKATGADKLADGIGGEFSYSVARQARAESTALLLLGGAGQAAQAADAAWRAVQLFAGQAPEQRQLEYEAEARADLAAAHLTLEALDAAHEALVPVFTLAPDQRTFGVARRLRQARRLLAQASFQRAPEARALGEQIEDFLLTTAEQSLPAGPHR